MSERGHSHVHQSKSAVLSPCRRYRYALWRDTDALGGEGTVLFVGLNPSTADETADDPTIRRCVRFARDWGYARMAMGNVYAYRATDPRELREADDPVGPENDEWLRRLTGDSLLTVAAWGASPYLSSEREHDSYSILTFGSSLRLDCLGQTKDLHPRHPLYLPASARPVPFVRRARVPA